MIEQILHSYLNRLLYFGTLMLFVKIHNRYTIKNETTLFNKLIQTPFTVIPAYLLCQTYALSGELDVGYDSRYISEGRNNIVDGGIAWIQLSHELASSMSLVGLYGAGNDYDELNLSLVYSKTVSEVDYYISFTRLEFFQDNLNDNELGLGAAYAFSTYVPFTMAVDAVYSTDAAGAFVELSLATDVVIKPDLTLRPYIKAGLDFGYASANKKGHNHSALGAVFTFSQSDSLSFNFLLEHTIAGSHVQRETNQKNQSWFGLHLIYSY